MLLITSLVLALTGAQAETTRSTQVDQVTGTERVIERDSSGRIIRRCNIYTDRITGNRREVC